MLEYLHIENIAVAKSLDINFNAGFNVLTGETGAGKSIIINSINMLLGAKMSKDIIRHGENRAVVYALFSSVNDDIYDLCDEFDIPYDKEDSFSISRSFSVEGKNTIKINSKQVTLMQLKAIGGKLVNIHGQNENQSFLNKANHLSLLDEYINPLGLLQEYKDIYSGLSTLKLEISKLLEVGKQKELMIDALKYQIKEISSAKLKNYDEEEKLIDLRNKLKSSEQLIKLSSTSYKALFKNESGVSASVLIDKAIEALDKLSSIEPGAEELSEKLKQINFEIEDIAENAKSFADFDGLENPQRQLELVEDRLAVIQRLKKKYAPTIKEILSVKEDAEKTLMSFESSEERLEELKDKYKTLYQNGCEVAKKLHQIRVKEAQKLSKEVKDALVFLDMPRVKFNIEVKEIEKEGKPILSANGYDDVEFMIATNAGEELSSMNRIASGGELARIMLALKSALSDKNGAQSVVYDEIDIGVSGSTSQKIGIKLDKISRGAQVICVTHSAQIAAFAHNHLFIKKTENNGRAETSISELNENERIEEIARIIGGISLTDDQFAAAKQLVEESKILVEK